MGTSTMNCIVLGQLAVMCGVLLVAIAREIVRIVRETKVLRSFKGFSGITMKGTKAKGE